jgi:aryl-alcohol dehydrogenase-like predicted oxidoreductase
MGMSEFYGPSDQTASVETLHHAIDIGVTFWDTAEIYGVGRNEELLGRALVGKRDRVVLATKFGVQRAADGSPLGLDGSPENVRRACEGSLKRLATDHIDLYYQHRMDPDVPIEDTVGELAKLVEAGKVRYIGLSEAGPDTLRRAAVVHPITALQTEYSLWSRDIEGAILDTCRELGIGIVPYSPLGRGFLSGAIKSPDDLDENAWRRSNPRFQGENFQKNLELVSRIEELARAKGCTPSQLALAWLLAQGADVAPIPGTCRKERLVENAGAVNITLSADELSNIDEVVPKDMAVGTRYPEAMMGAMES